jgi:hypothetical protein
MINPSLIKDATVRVERLAVFYAAWHLFGSMEERGGNRLPMGVSDTFCGEYMIGYL